MESISSFSNGMNSDVSKQIHSNDSYLQALNFRPLTELGGSNGSLVNVKGNKHSITFPELKDTYKLIVTPTLIGTLDGKITITINGSTTTVIIVNSSTTGLDIYNVLKALPNCFESTSTFPTTPIFAVSYLDDYVVVYQQPVYTLITTSPVTLVISITLINPITAKTRISFVDSANVKSTTQISYLTGSNNLILIGSGYIDDDIYLLTAIDDDTEINPHPNDSFSNLGTIWRLKIDDITKISTLTLIYNNKLDFTKFHPIAPSAILGRYESKGIQRLYWTDFYNTIRTILISDPQLMALDPTQISIFPAVSFEIPLLNSFLGGSLTQGSYEVCYRLKKNSGSISNYSQTSNIVNLQGDETAISAIGFNSYECAPSLVSSGRGISWNIWNIDTSWDTIEFFILYRAYKTDLPLIYVIPSENISNLNPFVFTLTTLTDLDKISIEEYLTLSSGFTHAKTVETKDNILFWGNVKLVKQKQISEIFDSRAFRAHTSNGDDILLTNNGNEAPFTLTSAIATPHTNDNINQYYLPNGDINTLRECYYKPGTSILGGTGKYISYEFATENILLSNLGITGSVGNDWFIDTLSNGGPPYSYDHSQPILNVSNPSDLILGTTDSDNQTYPISGIGTSKNPYFTSLLKGHQQEEIYRYAIQFFDLQGVPYFSEWIGDIKMPSYNDPCNNLTALEIAAGVNDFRNSFFYAPNNSIYGRSLCVKFTVDVSAISNLISGYQIIRVERNNQNKTMLGYGMLTNVYKESSVSFANLGGGMYKDTAEYYPPNATPAPVFGHPYRPWPNQNSIETLGQATTNNDADISDRMLTFDCFDFLTDGYSFQTGDKMLVRSKLKPINFRGPSNLSRYRTAFFDLQAYLTNSQRTNTQLYYSSPLFNGSRWVTGFDAEETPLYMLFYYDDTTYARNNSIVNRKITKGLFCNPGSSLTIGETGFVDYHNRMDVFGPSGDNKIPGQAAATIVTTYDTPNKISSNSSYGANDYNGEKLMALYYRPNSKQYGGNTYSNRSNNEYIACGSFIPLIRNNQPLINNKIVTSKVFNGDVFINNWDLQKMIKDIGGVPYRYYPNTPPSSTQTGSSLGLTTSTANARMSNMFYFPCTNTNNQAVRGGVHFDKSLVDGVFYYPAAIDEYVYQNYHSNEKTTTKFIPKPIDFIINDEWRNRIYFSDVKFDNEILDSWSNYPINQFYDVEGNYGGITALISLNQNIYFIQDKGFGMLMINPVSMVSDNTGAPIKLGSSTAVIQKHFYKALDVGSKHQWSIYKSQNTIAFIDIRQKKIFTFNGESLTSISDSKGQRNFIIKRLHDNIIINDNPIIGKGLLTTYDYQNSEFLFTIKNNLNLNTNISDENYTLCFSEYLNVFTSMYSFLPNMYINNNKYLLSVLNDTSNNKKIFLHNYGGYSNFYNILYPSTLKFIINEDPLTTKVFDNAVWNTESINDNIEWNDDLNIYPGSSIFPSYVDDVNHQLDTFTKIRCYNDYQNTDWVNLSLIKPTNNLTRKERNFNLQIPRNKFDYDLNLPSTSSLFDPSKLTKVLFGERMRDKYLIIDLYYPNTIGNRFIINNLKSIIRKSDR